MRINKKAISVTANTVMYWAILILVLIVVIMVIQQVAKSFYKLDAKGDIYGCRANMEAASKSGQGLISFLNLDLEFECETNHYGNLTIKETSMDKQKTEVLSQITHLLRDCWY